MYEELTFPIPDAAAFLRRLGLEENALQGLSVREQLNTLIWAYQTHIPFEDLNSSCLHQPTTLGIPELFDKMVTRERGGFCFEMNGLFTRLLQDLGFSARSVFCRILRGKDFLPPCTHRGIIVEDEDRLYYCDVGYGGPQPAGTVLIEDGAESENHGEIFRTDRYDPWWWTLSRTTSAGETEQVLQFRTEPMDAVEFVPVNYYCSTDPGMVFVKRVMLNLRTEKGSVSIDGTSAGTDLEKGTCDCTLTVNEGGCRTVTPLADKEAFLKALKDHFGIMLS